MPETDLPTILPTSQPGREQLMARLQDVTERLAAASRQDAVFGIVLCPALEALGGKSGTVLLVQADHLRVAARQGQDEAARAIWQDTAFLDRTPATDVLRGHEPLFFEHGGALTSAYPELEAQTGGRAAVASAVLPLFLDGQPYGVIALDFEEPHEFTPLEIRFLRTLAAQCAIALGRAHFQDGLERRVQERTGQLEEETRIQQALVAFTELVGSETSVLALCRKAFEVLDARFQDYSSAYYERENQLYRARVWTDNLEPELVQAIRSGLPLGVPSFAQALQTGQPVFIDGWDADCEGVEHTEAFGPVCIYPLVLDAEVRGIFTVGLRAGERWQARDRALLRALGRSLGLALERSAQARRLGEERAALDAFVAYSEAVGVEADIPALAQRAVEVLRARFIDCSGGYYAREGERWTLQTWTADLDARPGFLAALRAGLPADTPFIAQLLQARRPTFTEAWNAQQEGIRDSEVYGSVAAYPVISHGEVLGFITIGLKDSSLWSERDRAVFRAVGRSFDLALERAEQTRRLEAQNSELDARTRALEGFADLTHDLSLDADRFLLVRRAQELVMSLLGQGYALYYEPEGGRWRNRVQVGEVGNAELQAFIDDGPPVGQTPSVDLPWTSRQALYQDHYARGSDTPPALVQHVSTAVSLPVLRHGAVLGVFVAVLFSQRSWTGIDRAVLETTMRSLSLALERAESTAQLAQRTRELERSNAELEQFAYVASHDLQEPLRTVTSFSQLLASKHAGQLDEKAELYVRLIGEGTARMARLLQDLLAFSRLSSGPPLFAPVDTRVVLTQALQDLQAQLEESGAAVHVGELPPVQGDASQLRQVFVQLIGNALKFRRPELAPDVHIGAQRQGELVRFSVTDNGIGIAPEFFERIFTIFQRLHVRDQHQGNGIGLSITRKIVERHGGQLWLDSEPGRGSRFFFTLPAGYTS